MFNKNRVTWPNKCCNLHIVYNNIINKPENCVRPKVGIGDMTLIPDYHR